MVQRDRRRRSTDWARRRRASSAVVIDRRGGARPVRRRRHPRHLRRRARTAAPASRDFWRDEYRLNACIARYPKPYVAVMDGIVMGGGVGISAHGSARIVTERSRIGMPEVGIGFVPDVGGTVPARPRPGRAGHACRADRRTFGAGDAIAMRSCRPLRAVARRSRPAARRAAHRAGSAAGDGVVARVRRAGAGILAAGATRSGSTPATARTPSRRSSRGCRRGRAGPRRPPSRCSPQVADRAQGHAGSLRRAAAAGSLERGARPGVPGVAALPGRRRPGRGHPRPGGRQGPQPAAGRPRRSRGQRRAGGRLLRRPRRARTRA